MGKHDTGICSGFEFKTSKLAWMDEVVGGNSELESFSDYFFYEFA